MNDVAKDKIKSLLIELCKVPNSEERQTEVFMEITRLSPDPDWSEYVFGRIEYYDTNDNLDVYAVVEKIFNYKPIEL